MILVLFLSTNYTDYFLFQVSRKYNVQKQFLFEMFLCNFTNKFCGLVCAKQRRVDTQMIRL